MMAAPTQTRPAPPSAPHWRAPAADRGRSGRQPGTSPLAEAALVGLTLAAAIDLGRLFRHEASFLGPVVLTALAVHAVCWACRRSGLGLAVAALGSIAAAALVLSWTVFPHNTLVGLPTRGTLYAARHALSAAMTQFRTATPPTPSAPGFVLASGVGCGIVAFLADWGAFRMRATTEACLPSLSVFVFSSALAQGHGATLATGVWLAALLAFLVVREAGLERPGPPWFASRAGRGPAATMQTGVALGLLALLPALFIGTHFPGATTHGLVTWRTVPGGTGGGRTTSSPLVDIRSRLTNLSQVEAFTVTANAPEFWRTTSLDHFDGSGWSLNDTYRHTGSALPGNPNIETNVITARFDVTTLDSIWLPAAYRPVRYSGPGKVSFSADAGSLIADKATSDGLTYTVVSAVPAPDVATLRASPPVAPNDPVLARYLALPNGANEMPPIVLTIAREVTAGAITPYDQARRLQDYFLSGQFTYDLSVPAFDGTNAIVQFLNDKRGFCQQFAATYAAMARLLGLPARVAVGFTPGDPGSDGRLHVRDADAHSWPEVYFSGVGWVAFDPTPGRGVPNGQNYTGVIPQQAPLDGNGPPTTSTSPPTTTLTRPSPGGGSQVNSFVVSAPTSVTPGQAFKVTVTAKNFDGSTDTKRVGTVTLTSPDAGAVLPNNSAPLVNGTHIFAGIRLKTVGVQSIIATVGGAISGVANITVRRGAASSPFRLLTQVLLWCIPLVLLLLLTPLLRRLRIALRRRGLPTAPASAARAVLREIAANRRVRRVRRSRRRAAAATPEARILVAWTEVGEQLTLAGAPPRSADTPTEYAERAVLKADLHGEAARALVVLAESVVEVSYAATFGADGAADGVVREAEQSRKTITAAIRTGRSRWQRVLSALDPRSLVDSDRR